MTVRLTLLEAGACHHPEHVVLRSGRWTPMRFPALFALLEHDRFGPILFDTGYGMDFFEETRRFPASLYARVTPVQLREEEQAIHRLAARGIAASEVRHIVISHFHADHVGALRHFPRARFHFLRPAYEAVRGLRGWRALRAAFLPGLLPDDFAARARPLDPGSARPLPPEYAPFERGIPLLGDEALMAVELPGHAAGQLGLFVAGSDGERYLLAADACWHSAALRALTLPHPVATLLMESPRLYRATLERLHRFHRLHDQVHIIPSHCSEAQRRWVAGG